MTRRALSWLPFFFFILGQPAHASTLPNQTVVDTYGYGAGSLQTFGAGFSGSVSQFTIIDNSSSTATEIFMCEASSTFSGPCFPYDVGSSCLADFKSAGVSDAGGGKFYHTLQMTTERYGEGCAHQTTSTSLIFFPSEFYGIQIYTQGIGGGAASNVYAGGSCLTGNGPGCAGVADAYWATDFSSSTPGTSDISFVVPQNGTTTGLFNEWELNTSNTPALATCVVHYGLYPTTSTYVDYGPCLLDGFHTVPQIGGPLYTPSLTIPIHWAAAAELKDVSGNIVATSLEDFYLDPNYAGFATSTPMITACSNASNALAYDICSIFVHLFYPSNASLAVFSNLKSQISAKPPFGYFAIISADLEGLQNGTSTVVLMDASTTASFSGIFSPFRIGLVSVLWFFFAWWAFHRFRHFEL